MGVEPLRHVLDTDDEGDAGNGDDHSLGEKQLVAGGEGRRDRNQSAAGKDRGERPRSAKSIGRPAGDDAPDRRHPDGRTGEQAKVLDREVIRRRDARAERSRGEPHQEAPKKADGRYPKLFNLVAPHQCLLRWTIWRSVASKKRKRAPSDQCS